MHCTPHTPAHLAGALRQQFSFALPQIARVVCFLSVLGAMGMTAHFQSEESVLGLFLKQTPASMSQQRLRSCQYVQQVSCSGVGPAVQPTASLTLVCLGLAAAVAWCPAAVRLSHQHAAHHAAYINFQTISAPLPGSS
jgi:hypothetical protein